MVPGQVAKLFERLVERIEALKHNLHQDYEDTEECDSSCAVLDGETIKSHVQGWLH